MKSESFVSVVLVSESPIQVPIQAVSNIQKRLEEKYSDYEIVIISKGPAFEDSLPLKTKNLLAQVPSIRLIQLSTQVNEDVAWAAGLENSIGDFIVLHDHFDDPIDAIEECVELCKAGNDIVVGVSSLPQSLLYRFARFCGAAILRAIEYQLPKNATRLRCLSRRAANAVMRTGKFHHQFYMRIQKTGYPQCSYSYAPVSGTVQKKSILTALHNFVRLLVFNSFKPLRWVSTLGFLGSFAAFIFASYSLVIHLISGNVVQGWTTTVFFMSSLFMVQFVMMAFFGEYLGRLLDNYSEQADYSVVFEKKSVIMVNKDRVNVLREATSSDLNLVQTGRNR